jgi:hypothetical protein
MMDETEQITIRLTQMVNYLAKRVTPQRDLTKVNRAPGRGEWSVKEIVEHLRDTEIRIFAKMFALVTADFPDLRKLPAPLLPERDDRHSILTVMSQYRRLRQSTLSLLREIPKDAWQRAGIDTDNRTITIRDLATYLIDHDAEHLAQIDATLIERNALPHTVTPLTPAVG